MKRTINFLKPAAIILLVSLAASCKKEGCTDKNALNYDSKAKKDDGTCKYDTSKPNPLDPAVAVYTGQFEAAQKKTDNPDPACFIDLVNGKVYKVSEAAAHSDEIDLAWSCLSWIGYAYDYSYLTNPINMGSGSSYDGTWWDSPSLLAGWTVKNATKCSFDNYPTNMNDIEFDNIKTYSQFKNWYAGAYKPSADDYDFNANASEIDRVYWFDVSRNDGSQYYCLMHIPQAYKGVNSWAKFTLKIMKVH
jgi:hypothetical protein